MFEYPYILMLFIPILTLLVGGFVVFLAVVAVRNCKLQCYQNNQPIIGGVDAVPSDKGTVEYGKH